MRLGMSHFLTSQDYAISLCAHGAEGLNAVKRDAFDLIITDLKLPGVDGLEILKKAK